MLALAVLLCLTVPTRAMEFEAPAAPQSVRGLVEGPADSFGEGLWNVLRAALPAVDAALAQAARSCLAVCTASIACGTVRRMTGKRDASADLVGTLAVSTALLGPSSALIRQGETVIRQLDDYGRLLLPVMTGALAAQGGVTSSAALYTATAAFHAVLSSAVTGLLIPVLYLDLALSIGYAAIGEEGLGALRSFLRWAGGWLLKGMLYLFTGFLAVTGVVSGSADAAALKAAKLTISGAVPVVGTMLSDATEAVLVSAGAMRSAAGVYGVLTVCALCLGPFCHMGAQYLLLRMTAALCMSLQSGRSGALVQDFAAVMGLMLAMIGTQGVLVLISTVCFMKGVG